MKIIVSEYNGFCGGVKAAVLKADKILTDEKNTVTGNNSQQRCCWKIKNKGMVIVDDIPENKDAKFLIRSHGVGKNIYDRLEEKTSKLLMQLV